MITLLYSKWFIGEFKTLKTNMKFSFVILLTLFLAACKTSTVESRRQEKTSSYNSLAPELRALVDKGQIKVGLSADAVYIAWGAPSQILQGETEQGAATTWLYYGTEMEEYRHWNYREVPLGRGEVFLERYLDFDYQPRNYVSAEIIFVNGVVSSWRTMAKTQ